MLSDNPINCFPGTLWDSAASSLLGFCWASADPRERGAHVSSAGRLGFWLHTQPHRPPWLGEAGEPHYWPQLASAEIPEGQECLRTAGVEVVPQVACGAGRCSQRGLAGARPWAAGPVLWQSAGFQSPRLASEAQRPAVLLLGSRVFVSPHHSLLMFFLLPVLLECARPPSPQRGLLPLVRVQSEPSAGRGLLQWHVRGSGLSPAACPEPPLLRGSPTAGAPATRRTSRLPTPALALEQGGYPEHPPPDKTHSMPKTAYSRPYTDAGIIPERSCMEEPFPPD